MLDTTATFLAAAVLLAGMRDWEPEQWVVFFTAVGGFVTGIVAGVIAVIGAIRQNSQAQSIRDNRKDITKLALQTSPPAEADPQRPPATFRPPQP